MQTEHLYTLNVNNLLGEGILWDHHHNRALWTDIHNKLLYLWQPGLQPLATALPFRLGSFGLTTDKDWLVCAFEKMFALFNLNTGDIKPLADVSTSDARVRLNDGRVDRHGYFWAGTMDERVAEPLGAFYRLQNSGARALISDMTICNGLSWSPDGNTMYYSDSPKRTIFSADVSPETALPFNHRVFATTQGNAYPDGACVDADGCLWSAQWGAGKVVRYSPQGEVLYELYVPCQQPTCVAFGGPSLSWLMVTSANEGLEGNGLHPEDGQMFVYQTSVKGLREPVCSQFSQTGSPH